MNRFLLVCLLLGSLLPAQAQTEAWAEIARIRERYTRLTDYTADMEYRIYNGHSSQELVDLQTGKLQIWDNCHRLVLGELETVKNKKYLFQVDRQNKEMDVATIAAGRPADNGIPAFSDFSALDALLQKQKAVTRTVKEGIRIITFDMVLFSSEYEKIVVHLTPEGVMHKVILFFANPVNQYALDGDYKPRIEVTYLKQSFAAGLSEADFSEKTYFTVVNDQITPVSLYKNFKLF